MKVQVIVGATRTGRATDRIAKWVVNETQKVEGAEVELVDLSDYPMPFFDEAISPQYNPNRTPTAEVQKWLSKVAEAEAYIIVTPEYNRATSAVVKNAIDYLDYQFANKPVALVGHGSSGGAQAVASLRMIIPGALAVTVPKATFLTGISNSINDEGELAADVAARPYGPLSALNDTLEQLKWLSDAMTAARK